MNKKRDRTESRFFTIAFGTIIISIGLIWFFQTIGVLPESIKVLEYACPICVILFGIRIFTAHSAKGKNVKQEIMEDNHVTM